MEQVRGVKGAWIMVGVLSTVAIAEQLRERERERDKGNTKLTDRQTDSAYAFDMSGLEEGSLRNFKSSVVDYKWVGLRLDS